VKYRLVELLQCPACGGDLEVAAAEHASSVCQTVPTIQCRRFCALNRVSTIPEPDECLRCFQTEIVSGKLDCGVCGKSCDIVDAVPWLFKDRDRDLLSDTALLFGHLWTRTERAALPASNHVERVEEVLGESVVRGKIGLDAGSGSGDDTLTLARRHPSVELISLDLSEGVYLTKRAAEGLPNVYVIRGSLLELPLRPESCDFVYSFGVLHHTPDPGRGIQEMARVLREKGRLTVYLYEDHADNPWKSIPLKMVSAIRQVTVRLNPKVLSALCFAASPFVVLAFSLPAKILGRFKRTRTLAERMPFNFGSSPFSVHGDLLDRFGAPIEFRYSKEGIVALLRDHGLNGVRTTKLKISAGWVASGIKQAHGATAREAMPLAATS